MFGLNHRGTKGAIASLIAAGALCTGRLGQGIPACDNPDPKAGDCFTPTPGIPGCQDAECCNIVCSVDPYCCALPPFENNGNWDQICADEAVSFCNCLPEDVPENDECDFAIPIVPGTINVSNTCATAGEPDHASCNDGFALGLGVDIWYSFTPDVSSLVTITPIGDANWNTQLAVYQDCGCDQLEDPPLVCAGVNSPAMFVTIQGTCYLIRLGGTFDGSDGDGELTVEVSPVPEICIDGEGDCNEPHGGMGCENVACCALVCLAEPSCCGFMWDQVCADEAANHPQCTVPVLSDGLFLDPAEFKAALAETSKVLKGTENFPWLAPDNSLLNAVPDPFDTTVDIPGWIEAGTLLDNLTYYANTGGADSSVLAPAGKTALALITQGFSGATGDAVLADTFVNSFDIVSGPPAGDSHTAISMTLVTIQGSASVHVDVYDTDNNLIGTATDVPASPFQDQFFGIIAPKGVTIGRVNIWDPADTIGAEGVYNVTVYVDDDGGHPCEEWDLVPGNGIDVPDLLFLLANWVPNGPYDVPELLQLLSFWGPCPP